MHLSRSHQNLKVPRGLTQILISAHKDDLATTHELLSTLGALVVREEFCREVEECGGLSMIMDIMVNFPDDEVRHNQFRKVQILPPPPFPLLLKNKNNNSDCWLCAKVVSMRTVCTVLGIIVVKHLVPFCRS